MYPQTATTSATCTLNGQPVDCAQLAHSAGNVLKWGFGGLLVVLLIALVCTIFWIMMLVHAAKHDVPHKAIWIIAMILTGLIASIVYYFAVKRDFVPAQPVAASPVPPANPPVPPTQPTA